VVLQLGHQRNSDPYFFKAREIFESGRLGKVPLVRMYTDRTGSTPSWQFYSEYSNKTPPQDAGPETIDWNRFIANATERPFDRERFFLWRYWWEYATGIAGDLMSHFWDSLNMVMSLGVPQAVLSHGALNYYKEQFEVPDQWHVLFDYPQRDLSVQFNCTFHNRHMGSNSIMLGREATLHVSNEFCRLYEAEWKPGYQRRQSEAAKQAAAAGLDPTLGIVPPVYSMKAGEVEVSNHMQDFLDCARSRRTPRCGIDRAFQEAACVAMSVESYFKERKVKWDPVSEAIV
jgi:predicted dehydrogenase